MSDPWDDPDLKMVGDFITFDTLGDEIDGIVTAVGKRTFPASKGQPERTKPQVFLKLTKCTSKPELADGREVALIPGAHLQALLSQLRPGPGDRLWAKWIGNEKTGQPSPKKVFEAKVQKGAAPVAVASTNDDLPPF